MTRTTLSLPQQRSFGQTQRQGAWWLQPLLVFLGLGAFVVYSTWAAFEGVNYASGPYLSPMYSPLLFDAYGQVAATGHAWFGAWPKSLPAWPLTPAILVLWAPAFFRLTCYYYRGAYYKAFWADPLTCAVGEPRKTYWGERKWPLLIQNIHRYFMYLAVLYIGILSYDAWNSMWFAPAGMTYPYAEATHQLHFGLGVGTFVMYLNVILLGLYTFGCHSLRHWIGGRKDCVSRSPLGINSYDCVSCLNRQHMMWAWFSLFWVGFTDFYIRMCAAQVVTDWHHIF